MKKGRISITKNQTQAELERLRMKSAYLKKVKCLSSKQGKVTIEIKSRIVYELRNDFSVKVLLKLAQIPRRQLWISSYSWLIDESKTKSLTNHERIRFEEPSSYEKNIVLIKGK